MKKFKRNMQIEEKDIQIGKNIYKLKNKIQIEKKIYK
jgi:hypothetical protein